MRPPLFWACILSGLFTQQIHAAQFTILDPNICSTDSCYPTDTLVSSYVGPGFEGVRVPDPPNSGSQSGTQGAVLAGVDEYSYFPPVFISRAYDIYGQITNFNGLTVQRRVDTFTHLNIYRWLDTYTNNTSNPINTTIQFFGNLGSDLDTIVQSSSPFFTVTSDSIGLVSPGDNPVISHVFGNNIFAIDNITPIVGGEIPANFISVDNYSLFIDLQIDPGNSASLLFFNFLAFDLTDRSGDIDLAIATAQELVSHPYVEGLTQEQITTIKNFNVIPLPPAVYLFGTGLLGLVRVARRKTT